MGTDWWDGMIMPVKQWPPSHNNIEYCDQHKGDYWDVLQIAKAVHAHYNYQLKQNIS